ncbi:MAG TPA: hypothetical protein VHZ56_01440 [Devosia sp.]|nr:hypothetical protein [Devosia sp.]
MSAPNGKFEFDAGALTLPSSTFMARAAGTLTLPLGDTFGLQADFAAATAPGFNTSAALHVFTRDPQSYLIGGTLGIVRTPGAEVVAAGPEAELYAGRWTIEAWGGLAVAHHFAPATDHVGAFAMATLAYYLDDNLRLTAGVSSLDGFNAVHFGAEYLLDGFSLPVAVVGDARIGQDGSLQATIGLRGYIGAPGKSLIRRHREDDPDDQGTALIAAVGSPAHSHSQGSGSGGSGSGGDTAGSGDGGSAGSGDGGSAGQTAADCSPLQYFDGVSCVTAFTGP